MNRRSNMGCVIAWVILLAAMPVAVFAGASPGQESGISKAKEALNRTTPADQASAEAEAKAKAEARARMDAVLERGSKASARTRSEAETKLRASIEQVDARAAQEGNPKVAERLAAEFGMTAEAVLAEKQAIGASWGELMIAHTLDASSNSELTVEQIYQMKQEGHGWGRIAAGMGLELGDVVSAARAEAGVAAGLAKADGKVHPIRGASVGAHGSLGTGVKAGPAGVGVKAGAGLNVKVKTDRP